MGLSVGPRLCAEPSRALVRAATRTASPAPSLRTRTAHTGADVRAAWLRPRSLLREGGFRGGGLGKGDRVGGPDDLAQLQGKRTAEAAGKGGATERGGRLLSRCPGWSCCMATVPAE